MRAFVLAPLALLLTGCPLALGDFTIGDAGSDASPDASPDAPADAMADVSEGGGCGDTTSDPSNCGACGHACLAGHACTSSACAPWATVSAPADGAREKAASCALADGRVFVWGGANASGTALATGDLYDPTTDGWTAIATANAPTARVLAAAVCVGTKVVAWGGGDPAGTVDYKDGAVYDVTNDSWTAMASAPGAVPGQRAAYALPTQNQAVYWCGVLKNGAAANGGGALYDPNGNTWTQTGGGGPQALLGPAVAATSTTYVVFGGTTGGNDKNDLYTLQGTTWTKSAATGAPSVRHGAFAAFDGDFFVTWGGLAGTNPLQSGGTYVLPAGPWAVTGTGAGVPTARSVEDARAGWAAAVAKDRTLFLGGILGDTSLSHDGAIYNSSSATWTSVPSWPSSDDHEWGVAVWTGKELVVWGGRTGSTLSATGDRFAPSP